MKTKQKKQRKSKPKQIADVFKLNSELEDVIKDFTDYHDKMYQMQSFYENSAVYEKKSGDKQHSALKVNFLETFADKNIDYTAGMPGFKVPLPADPEGKESASKREKVLLGTHTASGTEALHEKWMFDATLRSVMISETKPDYKARCVKVKRYDPRFCFWQKTNDNDFTLSKFWAVYPITKSECKARYGVEPSAVVLDVHSMNHPSLTRLDGEDWFLLAIRWTETTRTAWVGDVLIEDEHNHQLGEMPIDIAFPFTSGNIDGRGKFYLDRLVALQAEYNHGLAQRSSIVKRKGNPVVWSRGVISKQIDEVKRGLAKQSGGFIALKQAGEVGVLDVPETRMIDNHMADLIVQMLRVSGFGLAAFGESVGANTSGDALGMYFSPTERAIKRQNIHHKAFYQSINTKILRFYEIMATNDSEEFKIAGYSPAGTIVNTGTDDEPKYSRTFGSFSDTFTKQDIAGNYTNIVMCSPVTPKDDMANKKFWMEAVNAKFVSRQTGYEEIGLLSPQDELRLLETEQGAPALNPSGIAELMKAEQGVQVPEGSEDFEDAEVGADVQQIT